MLCPDEKMSGLLEFAGSDPDAAVAKADELLAEFPQDARLHFLRGSLLIGLERHIEAHQSLSRAVEIEPDYVLARFQLGFFQLTSGEVENALTTWARLDLLPDGHYLRHFVSGLRCLIRDDFEGAKRELELGIAANDENAPMNSDMQLLIAECDKGLGSQGSAETPGDEAETDASLSPTALLLGLKPGRTQH